MKTLTFKISLIFFLVSGPELFGQKITTSTMDGNVTARIDQIVSGDLLKTETREYQVKEAVIPEGSTIVDSTNLQYIEFTVIQKNIQLDPKKINEIFPEAVSVGPNGELSVDTNSLVAILLKAVIEQQQIIDQLNARLSKIEQKF
jgi:hypothetical protein